MVELYKVGNGIGLFDGENALIIPFEELDSFDDKFYKLKRDIAKSHVRLHDIVISGGVSHPTKTIEAQLAEIESDQ